MTSEKFLEYASHNRKVWVVMFNGSILELKAISLVITAKEIRAKVESGEGCHHVRVLTSD